MASSRERDFFRWVKVPLAAYKAHVPIQTDAGKSSNMDGKGTAEIALVLPSDHLKALHEAGPKASALITFLNWFASMCSVTNYSCKKRSCKPTECSRMQVILECLGSWKDFGAMWQATGFDELSSTHIPIVIHEDGVPHFSGILD